jgi:hypothetical protein
MRKGLLAAFFVFCAFIPVFGQTSIEPLIKAAKAGDSKAQHQLALRYFEGRGVGKDDALGAKWLIKAAEGGYLNAQIELAHRYSVAEGIAHNQPEALRWFLKSLEQTRNKIVIFNYMGLAKLTFALAKHHGVEEIDKAPENIRMSFRIIEAEAKNGNGYAQYMFAWAEENGTFGLKDPQAAAKLFFAAAKNGCPEAQLFVAMLHMNGDRAGKDYTAAALWLEKAAMQGNVDSQVGLAALYYWGKGVSQNYVKGYAWALVAKAQDSKDEMLSETVSRLLNEMSSQQVVQAQEQADILQGQISLVTRKGMD